MSDKLITLFSHYEEKVRQFHLGRIPVEMIDGPRNEIIARIKAADVTKYVNREGWRLVPITPTPAMYEAFNGVSMDMSVTPNQFKVGYEAMLAAAPKCEPERS
jgi:hypothetical protein